MAKYVFIFLISLSLKSLPQVTILNQTNLKGFNITGLNNYPGNFPNGIEVSCIGSCSGSIDTTLNLTGYDSLHIVFTAYSNSMYSGSTICKINNIPISTNVSQTSYTVSTTNTSSLAITATLATSSVFHPRILGIKALKIIGYPTITSINKNSLSNDFSFYENKLTYKGEITKQKLYVYDLLGKIQFVKELDKTNSIDINPGIYFIRVVENERLLYSQKICVDN